MADLVDIVSINIGDHKHYEKIREIMYSRVDFGEGRKTLKPLSKQIDAGSKEAKQMFMDLFGGMKRGR